MTFYGNQQSQFYHIARHPELVVTKDRDVIAFWPDMLVADATDGMALYRDSGKTSVQYQTSGTQSVKKSERALCWARMSGDEIVGGMRWVPYIISSDVDTASIAPLREVIAPRVAYDKSSNTLSLWFWTNVKQDYDGIIYDETQLEPVLVPNFGLQVPYDNSPPPSPGKNAKRVLCYAVGTFYPVYVEGGALQGFQTTATASSGDVFDKVPVFSTPRILNIPAGSQGVAVDGWYGIQGPQGFQGPPGIASPECDVVTGLQMNPHPTGFQALQKKIATLRFVDVLETFDWTDVLDLGKCFNPCEPDSEMILTITAPDSDLPITWCGITWVTSGTSPLGPNQRYSGESASVCPDNQILNFSNGTAVTPSFGTVVGTFFRATAQWRAGGISDYGLILNNDYNAERTPGTPWFRTYAPFLTIGNRNGATVGLIPTGAAPAAFIRDQIAWGNAIGFATRPVTGVTGQPTPYATSQLGLLNTASTYIYYDFTKDLGDALGLRFFGSHQIGNVIYAWERGAGW